MPRQRKLLNVRSMLERVVNLSTQIDIAIDKYNITPLPPTYMDELHSIALLARQKLKIVAKSGTRKDIRIETPTKES